MYRVKQSVLSEELRGLDESKRIRERNVNDVWNFTGDSNCLWAKGASSWSAGTREQAYNSLILFLLSSHDLNSRKWMPVMVVKTGWSLAFIVDEGDGSCAD